MISRDPATGEILELDSTLANIGSKKARGIDFLIDFAVPLSFSLARAGTSSIALQFAGSRLLKLADQKLNCAGRFGFFCFNPQPRWSWTSRLSWINGPVTSSIRWRHVGAVKDDDDDVEYVIERIDDYGLFDLAFAFRVNDRFTMHLGVNNLFDRRPPILGGNAGFSAGNTYPSTYDVLGRDFFLSFDVKL